MKRFLIYISEAYGIPIGIPLENEIEKRGYEVKWFCDEPGMEDTFSSHEIVLINVNEVMVFNPDVVLVTSKCHAFFWSTFQDLGEVRQLRAGRKDHEMRHEESAHLVERKPLGGFDENDYIYRRRGVSVKGTLSRWKKITNDILPWKLDCVVDYAFREHNHHVGPLAVWVLSVQTIELFSQSLNWHCRVTAKDYS